MTPLNASLVAAVITVLGSLIVVVVRGQQRKRVIDAREKALLAQARQSEARAQQAEAATARAEWMALVDAVQSHNGILERAVNSRDLEIKELRAVVSKCEVDHQRAQREIEELHMQMKQLQAEVSSISSDLPGRSTPSGQFESTNRGGA